MRNCNGDPQELKANLDNIVDHYRNDHVKCKETSRCKRDKNYIPSREILSDSVAIRLLKETIRTCDVYKHAENYVHHIDTFFVESFNNTINIFQDKRISTFGDTHYKLRSNLAICHWNENVKKSNDEKSKTLFTYRENIWKKWINSVYVCQVWRPF